LHQLDLPVLAPPSTYPSEAGRLTRHCKYSLLTINCKNKESRLQKVARKVSLPRASNCRQLVIILTTAVNVPVFHNVQPGVFDDCRYSQSMRKPWPSATNAYCTSFVRSRKNRNIRCTVASYVYPPCRISECRRYQRRHLGDRLSKGGGCTRQGDFC
jgi:hypothetical protein